MSEAEEIIMVYITAPSEEEALKIGDILVEERLAACVNVIPGIKSIYRWEGKIVHDSESVMILKTMKSNFQKISSRVKELHSYTCPCILSYPSDNGYQEYTKWVSDETL